MIAASGRGLATRPAGLAELCFWGAAAGASWVLAGYPLALAARRPRPWRRGTELPRVTIIVPAFYERRALAAKLRALRELDYPRELLEVVVVVDGDPELARIAAGAAPGARLSYSKVRRGKAAAINRGLSLASGDLVVMTDANNVLDASSLRVTARHLADPEIWAVVGRRGETGSLYARYEDLLRRLETRSGSVAGASGEYIAVRRERLEAFPEGVINDDLWLLCELVRGGGRVIYEPAAGSSEAGLAPQQELRRRARITAGRTALLGEIRRAPGAFRLRLVSHKAGRLALPTLLATTLASSLALSRRPPYRVAALAQLAAWAPGLLSLVGIEAPGRAGSLGRASRELVVGVAGTALGTARGIRASQPAAWEPVR